MAVPTAPGPLSGKVFAVTGASRGIGLAMAHALTQVGAGVALVARESDHLRTAAAALPEALAVPAELSDPTQVRAAFAAIDTHFGRLDGLVNNAALGLAHRIEDLTDEEISAQVGVNYLAPVYCVRSAIPLLRRNGGGHVVNVSSESAHDPFPYLAIYASTKAGMEVFTHAVRNELRGEHIRVTLLVAGLTNTGGFSGRWDPEVRAAANAAWEEGGYLTRVAGRTPQEPADVAEALVFVLTRPGRTMTDVIWARASE
jgi:NAD(P)-dependent dehydrogenase (short-subunit alcohol dehydrogenase family)